MIRSHSSWALLPSAPNIIAPRHSGLTRIPVTPRVRTCMVVQVTMISSSAPTAGLLNVLDGGRQRAQLVGQSLQALGAEAVEVFPHEPEHLARDFFHNLVAVRRERNHRAAPVVGIRLARDQLARLQLLQDPRNARRMF